MSFDLHPRLRADTFVLGDLPLSRLLLMDDTQYPWCILVPRRAAIHEIYELDDVDRTQLLAESCMLGEALMKAFHGDKLNVAALGNVVPQLHVHHIVRFEDDAAWPAPVWGRHSVKPYDDRQRRAFVQRLAPHVTGARWED